MDAAPLRLVTRGSALARAQTALAELALSASGSRCETVVVRTSGDRHQEVSLEAMTGQGWFTSELELALAEGRGDVAVHSAKDLPSALRDGLAVAAHLPRADARDALVLRGGAAGSIASLAAGARVGTGSARRAALLAALRPDVDAVPIRGNVDTRLRKLDAGDVDALLLAAAGLDRLGLGDRAAERLDPRVMVPAPAQGAVALEICVGGSAAATVAAVDDAATTAAVVAERTVLERLGGGCRLPLGAWARREGDRLVLTAALRVADMSVRRVERGGDPRDPVGLGVAVAVALAA